MLSIQEATRVIKKNLPKGSVQSSITYGNLFVFQVFHDDPDEGMMDPFFSVDKTSGEFAEFSILTDGNPVEIMNLFLEAQKSSR